MKSIAIFLLFVGFFLIITGYYNNLNDNSYKTKTVVKYVPRTVYEDQLSDDLKLEEFYKSMFEKDVPPNIYNSKI